jgi:hypothetical protein
LAWLYAPVDSEDKDAEKQSRIDEINAAISVDAVGDDDDCIFTQAFIDDYTRLPMIDSEYRYLIEWINELGYFLNGGMGAVVITYSEISAWAQLTQNTPTPFDVKTLRAMSHAFIAMQETAKKQDCPDPLIDLTDEN